MTAHDDAVERVKRAVAQKLRTTPCVNFMHMKTQCPACGHMTGVYIMDGARQCSRKLCGFIWQGS